MMLAPEKRTKFDFLNYAKSSAILCMATSGFEPRSTRTTRRSETRYACRSPTACPSASMPPRSCSIVVRVTVARKESL